MGFWLEIVTLLIPGFNDSDEELRQLTDFWPWFPRTSRGTSPLFIRTTR